MVGSGTPDDPEVVDAESPRDQLNKLREARERRRTQMQGAYLAANEDVNRLEEELAEAKRLRAELAGEMTRAGVPLPKHPARATVREARDGESATSATTDTVRNATRKVTDALKRWW